MVYNPSYNQKYVFTGSAVSDFSNTAMWVPYAADAAGTPPATLGYVDSALQYGAINHLLGLPCCASAGGGSPLRHANPDPHTPTPVTNTIDGIKVYPNPATMTVNFQFPASDNVTIRLMDVTGQLLQQQVVQNNTSASFNVQGYAPGVYIYQVVTQGKVHTGKLVVE